MRTCAGCGETARLSVMARCSMDRWLCGVCVHRLRIAQDLARRIAAIRNAA